MKNLFIYSKCLFISGIVISAISFQMQYYNKNILHVNLIDSQQQFNSKLMYKKIDSHSNPHRVTVIPAIVKEAENLSIDANKLAEEEHLRSLEQQLQKKSKMESFLNSTKMNAMKIQKKRMQQHSDVQQIKKSILETQKQIKSKYTVVKKVEEVRAIKREPVKIDWKKAQGYFEKINVPEPCFEEQHSDNDDQLDTEAQTQKITNPQELIKFRESIRKAMLSKKL